MTDEGEDDKGYQHGIPCTPSDVWMMLVMIVMLMMTIMIVAPLALQVMPNVPFDFYRQRIKNKE